MTALRDVTSTNAFTITDGNNTFTAIASDSLGRGDTNAVTINLPATNSYSYDLNGNLLSVGTRTFDYDDENQLIRVTETNAWKSEFTYDGRMRRRIRKEFTWQYGSWIQTNEVRYIYDGNVVVQERDTNNLPIVTYTRGNDLSGSLQGAGGIGGLLARRDRSTGQTTFYHADGNGNIAALISSAQFLVAKYLYDPYGNILSESGPLAEANLYRFSSKELHGNSGLIYYLYRFYDANLQRWLNRDPIEETGGLNLFTYVYGQPTSAIDPLGLLTPQEIEILENEAKGTLQLIAQQQDKIKFFAKEVQNWKEAVDASAKAGADQRGVCTAIYNSARADYANATALLRQLQAQYRNTMKLLAAGGTAAGAAASSLWSLMRMPIGNAIEAAPGIAACSVLGAGAFGAGAGLVVGNLTPYPGGGTINQNVQEVYFVPFWNWWIGVDPKTGGYYPKK